MMMTKGYSLGRVWDYQPLPKIRHNNGSNNHEDDLIKPTRSATILSNWVVISLQTLGYNSTKIRVILAAQLFFN